MSFFSPRVSILIKTALLISLGFLGYSNYFDLESHLNFLVRGDYFYLCSFWQGDSLSGCQQVLPTVLCISELIHGDSGRRHLKLKFGSAAVFEGMYSKLQLGRIILGGIKSGTGLF